MTSLSREAQIDFQPICSPRNLIGQSQSGTGKTAAFTLNMLSRVDPALMTPQVGLGGYPASQGLNRSAMPRFQLRMLTLF